MNRYIKAVLPAASVLASIPAMAEAPRKTWWPIDVTDSRTQERVSYKPLERSTKDWKLCAVFPHMKDSFWVAIDFGIVEEARRQGVSVAVYEAGGYDQLPKQLRQFDDCMASKADAILLGAISEAGLKQKLEEAAARNIPVIAIANPIADAPVAGKFYASFASTGKLTGDALLKKLAGTPAKAVTFPGPQGSGWAEGLNQGFVDRVKGQGVEILDRKFGDTGVNVQLQLVQDALQAYPAMDVIWGTAPTVEAAINAVFEAGRKDVTILGSYENQAMMDAVERGDIFGFATNFPALSGRVGVDMAVRALEKKLDVPAATSLAGFVSSDNIKSVDRTSILAPAGFKPVYSVTAGK